MKDFKGLPLMGRREGAIGSSLRRQGAKPLALLRCGTKNCLWHFSASCQKTLSLPLDCFTLSYLIDMVGENIFHPKNTVAETGIKLRF
jgi:hypothetical protein